MFPFLCEEKKKTDSAVLFSCFLQVCYLNFRNVRVIICNYPAKMRKWRSVISNTTFYIGVQRRTRVDWRYNQWKRNGKHCSRAAIELWMHAEGCQVRKNCYVDCKKPFMSAKTAFVNFFSVLIQKPLQATGCPKSSFLQFNALKLLKKLYFYMKFLKDVDCSIGFVFRSSVTGMPPLRFYHSL